MKSFFLIVAFLFASVSAVSAATDPVMCTMEYAPVCGSVQVQCITAPCEPVRETFGNACMAGVAKATDVTQGECVSTPIVGGDSDEHGCKASAGYSWNATLAQCARSWEVPDTLIAWAYGSGLTQYSTAGTFGYDRTITRQEAAAIFARAGEKTLGLRYASYPDNCNVTYQDESTFDITLKNEIYSACAFDMMHGQNNVFSPTRSLTRGEALAVLMRAVDGGKKDESGSLWYGLYADRAQELDILSFANFKGFDSAITRGELIEWIYRATSFMKTKNITSIENPLLGQWTLISYNSMSITSTGYTLTFERDKVSAKFCNSMFGSYTLSGNTISSPGLASTMMYCEGQSMTLENAFALDGATYSLQALRLMAGATGPTMHLIITTKKGDVYVYGM